MTTKTTLPILLALLLAAFWAAAPHAQSPPRDLQQVGDHWTAWNPPQEFPEGAEIYTIEGGDTLWDLAQRFYDDPYLWPQLWERNQYIQDSHWIYPGDPLVLSVEITTVDTLADLDDLDDLMDDDGGTEGDDSAPSNVDELGIQVRGMGGAPRPLGSESDIYCSGFISGMDEEFPVRISGSEYGAVLPTIAGLNSQGFRRDITGVYGISDTAKYGLDTGDIVYLDQGRKDGLSAGQLYVVVSPRQRLDHPVSGKTYGRLYRYQGRIRVLSVQADTAIGEIVHSCDPILVGDALEPFEPEPVPLGRDTPLWPLNFPAEHSELTDAPVVLHGHGDVVTLGQDSVVYVDLGEDDDVVPGDLYTIYRINREGLPPMVIGELAILSIRDRGAVGRILKARYSIYAGDRLVQK